MFFDRDQNARRQRQIAYRSQLKQQIQLKNSKILQKPQRSYNNKPETFSLLKNIQVEQENRKKRQQNFYTDLQKQIQFEKQQKKRKKQQQAQRQFQEQQRIKKDHQMLRQRAEMQKIQEKKKKGAPLNNQEFNKNTIVQNKNTKRIQMQHSNPNLNARQSVQQNYRQQNQSNPDKNFYSRLKTSQSQRGDNQLPLQTFQGSNQRKGPFSLSSVPTYVNRIENEPFNFLPQRKYMDSYFQQLLGEKRKIQQQAASISQLNKLLYQQKSRTGKIQSRGLGQLKKLQHMLNQKGANYMANISYLQSPNDFDSLKKLTVPQFDNSRVPSNNYNNGWRKLD